VGEFSWFDKDPTGDPAPRRGVPVLKADVVDGPFGDVFDEALDGAFTADRGVDAAVAARQAIWSGLGDVDADMLGPAIDPAFLGAPEWPAERQAFLRVRRSGSVLLASDGLSDPHLEPELVEPGLSGFGLEVFIEASDPALAGDGIESVVGTWAFHLLYEMAQNAASMGDLAERLDALEIVSMELQDFSIGTGWDTADGSVAVLLGVPADGLPAAVETGAGRAQLVAVTLLRPRELDYVASGRAEARAEIAQRLAAAGVHHRCDLSRPSVV
jgi:hypothetical protein